MATPREKRRAKQLAAAQATKAQRKEALQLAQEAVADHAAGKKPKRKATAAASNTDNTSSKGTRSTRDTSGDNTASSENTNHRTGGTYGNNGHGASGSSATGSNVHGTRRQATSDQRTNERNANGASGAPGNTGTNPSGKPNIFTHLTTGATELLFNFIASSNDPDQTPPPVHGNEMAVIGRSNVGKSSLLNAIAKRTQGKNELAKTSSTPGKTRLLNVFAYKHGGQLVDLPGYGYAKISKAERNRWQTRMEHYLLNREYLTMVLSLVDGEVGPSQQDLATMAWMLYNEIPYTVVATKIDKIKPSQMQAAQKKISDSVELPISQIFWVSAQKGTGMEELRNYVHNQLVK